VSFISISIDKKEDGSYRVLRETAKCAYTVGKIKVVGGKNFFVTDGYGCDSLSHGEWGKIVEKIIDLDRKMSSRCCCRCLDEANR